MKVPYDSLHISMNIAHNSRVNVAVVVETTNELGGFKYKLYLHYKHKYMYILNLRRFFTSLLTCPLILT